MLKPGGLVCIIAPSAGNQQSAEAPGAGEESADAATPAVVHIEQLGEVMQDAWRRLRLSGPFRPVVSLAWEQGSTPPFPQLRMHDANVVLTQDPWAAIRARLQAGLQSCRDRAEDNFSHLEADA